MKGLSAFLLLLFAHYYVTAQNKQSFKVRATQPVPNVKIKSPIFNRAEFDTKNKRANLSNIRFRPVENDLNNNQKDSILVVKKINRNTAPIFIYSQLSSANKINGSLKNRKPFDTTALAKQYLLKVSSLLGWENMQPPFEIKNISTDALGKTHIKLDQIQDGYKVYGAQIAIHLNEIGEGNIFSGYYADATKIFKKNIAVNKDTALKKVIKDIESKSTIIQFSNEVADLINYYGPVIDTVYYQAKNSNEYTLAYKITVRANYIDHYEYLIDAVNGEIIKRINKACTLYGPVSTTAVDLNGQAVSVNSYYNNGNYYLWDVTKPMFRNTTNGVIRTWDGLGTNENNLSYSEITSADNSWLNQRAVSAHFNAGKVYDYYYNAHSRNSIDNKGKNLISFINIKDVDNTELDNAYYSYPFMLYGNGKKYFKPLAGSLDVAAHEITHAVTDFSAQLAYEFQSGSLSESISDIFGAMVDSSNWLIGEQIVKPLYFPSGALRSLEDPHNGGGNNWQPKHMNEYVFLTQDQDNGGVHTNSGITNHAFYLLAKSIGRTNAAKIFYRALTTYLTSYAQFIDLRLTAVQSAEDLFDSATKVNIINQVKLAFDQVGIVDVVTEYIESYIPVNPGNEALLFSGLSSNMGIYSKDLHNNITKVLARKANTKPTLTDDGQLMMFVGSDYRIYAANPGLNFTQTITNVQTDPIWHSVAISKDGKRLAATTLGVDTAIFVFDLTKAPNTYKKFIIHNPTNSHGVSTTYPLYADIMEWDYNGEYLYYDASNTTGSFDFWDISKIKVWDNQLSTFTSNPSISKLIQLNVNSGENIGNPTLTKNSPYIMALDYFKEYSGDYYIFGYDMLHNQLDTIIRNNTVGFPSYNKYDTKLAYQTDMTGYEDYAVNTVNLNADKISAASIGIKAVDTAKWPIYFANGVRAFYVPPTPTIIRTGLLEFCKGDSLILHSNTSYGNRWYINGVLSSTDTGSNLTVKSPGKYFLKTVLNGVSSLFSDTIEVLANDTPPKPISIYADTIKYCLHQSSVALNIMPLAGHQIVWYDTSRLGGIGTSTATVPKTDSAGDFNYFVSQVNNKGCESGRTSIAVKVFALPDKPLVNSNTVCRGNISTLQIDSSLGLTYKWYSTLTSGLLLHQGRKFDSIFTTLDTFKVFVSASKNGCESESRTPAMMVINDIPNIPIVNNDTVCNGSISTVRTDSLVDIKYKWYNALTGGWLIHEGSKLDTLITNTDTVKLYVSASKYGCESNRTLSRIIVNPVPIAPLVYSDTVCKGNKSKLWVDSLQGVTYNWYNALNNGSLIHSGSSFDTLLSTLDTFIVYISTIKNFCESNNRTTGKLFVHPIPNAPVVHNDTICKGELATLWTDSLPGYTYKWYNTLLNGLLLKNSTRLDTLLNNIDTFKVYVSASKNGCESNNRTAAISVVNEIPTIPIFHSDTVCKGVLSTIWMDSLPGITYKWYNTLIGGTLIHQGSKLDTLINSSDTTKFYVSATKDGCESNRTLGKVIVNPTPAAPTVYSDTVCKGNKSKLWVDSVQDLTYNWYNSLLNGSLIQKDTRLDTLLSNSNTVNVYVTASKNGCESNRSGIAVLLKNKLAKPELIYGDTIQYCLNTIAVSLSSNVLQTNQLLWYDTLSVGGKPSLVPVLPDVSKSGITNYYVSQINERYCESDRKQITVKVNPKPVAPLVQSFKFCADEQPHVLTINPTQNHVNIWFGTDTLTNNTSQSPPEILANKPGIFKYYVSQYNVITGCMSNTSSVNVSISEIPETPLIKQDATGKLISSIPFGNRWYRDSILLSDTGAEIKPTKTGYYTVRAAANGCNGKMSKKYYYQLEQLNDLSPNEYFNLFPNPFNTSFRIDFSLYQNEKINVSIYELASGKLMEQRLNITTGTAIPFNPLMEGVYIVKVTTSNNQRSIVRKIIKRNK